MNKQSTQKLGKLEALRGLAAFYVMLGHTFSGKLKFAGKDFSILLDFGQEAVILFFVLSGFVIQYSFEKSKDKTFGLFFMKRFLRIYIPLVIVFAANYILFSFQRKAFISPDWLELAGNMLMLQDAGALKTNVICNFFLGNSPLWSLSYEWWFYMIFFFIATRYRKHASLIVYISGIAAAISYLFFPNFVNRVFMYLMIWWAGADMALLYLKGQQISFRTMYKPLLFLLVTVCILALNVYFNRDKLAAQLGYSSIGISPYLELRHFSFAVISIAGAIIWKHLRWIFFDKTVGLFEPFAKISFGVYISHWFLVAKATYLDGIIESQVLKYALYFSICFLFAYIVERKIYPYLSNKILAVSKKINSQSKAVAGRIA